MNSNLTKSLIIGSILGIVIAVCQIDSSSIGLLISICLCVLLGLVTVAIINEKPNIYALIATLVSSFFLCAFYGFKYGVVYTLGVAGIYGILSVQIFQATFIASDNVMYIIEKLFKNK